MSMIDVGELRLETTGVRRFLLFQSLPQLASWAAIVASMFGVCTLVVRAMGGVPPDGDVIVGGIVGTLPSLWLARRAGFRVRGPARAQAFAVLEGRLGIRFYAPPVRIGAEHVFLPKLPRWLRWDEQTVRIAMGLDGMVVTGPYGTLLGLRRVLKTTFAD